MTNIQVFDNVDYSDVVHSFVTSDGTIRVAPADEWRKFPWPSVRMFMHYFPIYVLPTKELLDTLFELISGFRTIEIGAGSGNIGRNLGIRMTDSYLQDNPQIKAYYLAHGQPTITYPKDVLRCDALSAVRIFKPECVLGCYVTHWSLEGAGSSWGVKFDKMLPKIRRLILVGNTETHGANPIMKIPHDEVELDGLITRCADAELNRIFIWDR